MSVFKFKSDNANKKWDDNTNYTAEINVTDDPAKKAELERLRNDKIDRLGLPYKMTFDHNDVGTMMMHGMENGISGADLMKLGDYRENKALTTPGLEKYAYDEIQDAAKQYYYNDLMGVGGQFENRPVYNDKYGAAVDKLFDRVMNGEKFSYDVESDPSYQSYKDMYTREGNRAMQDTLAQVAQNAGGNNSYAVSAAAQANNYYMQQLADKVPELYNAAYNRYLNEENLKRQDLELARMLESDDYNRYLGDMGVFQTNVGLANNLYNSQLDREMAERQWRYGEAWDNKKWNYEVAQAEKTNALNQISTLISMGQTPKDELFEKAGITDKQGYLAMAQMYGTDIANSQYAATLENEYQAIRNKMLEEELKAIGNTRRGEPSGGYYGGEDEEVSGYEIKPKSPETSDFDSFVDEINEECREKYGRNAITVESLNGESSYKVAPAAREKVAMRILNNDSLSDSDAEKYLRLFGLDDSLISDMVKDKHYK